MNHRMRRFVLCMLALAFVSLSVAPVALCAANHGHFHMSCTCSVCTAIRDDLVVLNAVATVAFLLIIVRLPLLRLREGIVQASAGSPLPRPVALKVRMND